MRPVWRVCGRLVRAACDTPSNPNPNPHPQPPTPNPNPQPPNRFVMAGGQWSLNGSDPQKVEQALSQVYALQYGPPLML